MAGLVEDLDVEALLLVYFEGAFGAIIYVPDVLN